MAVPAQPKMSDVYDEFDAPAGTPLSAFVRGGAWVPNVAANAGVPTSPPIRLSDLAGAVKYVPISLSRSGPTAGYQFRAEPGAPSAVNVTAGPVTITVSGGNPGPSVTWQRLSGSTSISPPPAGDLSHTFGASLSKNTTISAVFRCTVSDGISSDIEEFTITLQYETSG